MTIKEFRNHIIRELGNRLGEEYIVVEHDVDKINRRACQGIAVHEAGNSISPVIYMEDFFEEYMEYGRPLDSIVNTILDIVKNADVTPPVSTMAMEVFTDWDVVKERVKAKLIPVTRNEKYLEKNIYIPFLNLAVVFYIDIYEVKDGFASVTITKDLLKEYGISVDELYRQAQENMGKDFQILPLYLAFMDMLGNEIEDHFPIQFDPENDEGLYLLCSRDKLYGASRIVSEQIRMEISSFFRGLDIFVLPSSQHELILIPAVNGIEAKDLLDMVLEVNHTQLAEEDFLADNVYLLNGKTHEISIAA